MARQGQAKSSTRHLALRRVIGVASLLAAVSLGAPLISGCRTTNDDVHRWANTANGPRRLVAVLTHKKYPMELRVEAAMTLIEMKPRGGRRIGIQGSDDFEGVLDALGRLSAEERAPIVAAIVPRLEAEMLKPVPEPAEEGAPPVDGSYPYKDAAFALLTTDEGALMPDQELQKRIKTALIQWGATNFDQRIDESSQIYGMQQMFRALGADGVRPLAVLLVPGADKIDNIAALIADLGDDATKLKASAQLVAIAKHVDSAAWAKEKAALLKELNAVSGVKDLSEDRFKAQLEQYQEEELLRVFQSMKKVGKNPIVNHLLQYAHNEQLSPKRRASALAALEGHLDRDNPKHAEAIMGFVRGENTPDLVRDIATKRAGELPRKAVINDLYAMFDSSRWQLRWIAAGLILKMSETPQVDEFMEKLGGTRHMAMSEPLIYGPLLGDMKGTPSPEALADKYAARGNPVQARLTALGYYYKHGTKSQLAKLGPYTEDRQKVPSCPSEATDCEWQCAVQNQGKTEVKEVSTVADFVNYCVKPAMEQREKLEGDAQKK